MTTKFLKDGKLGGARGVSRFVMAGVLLLALFMGSTAQAGVQLLLVEGEIEGEILQGSAMFPAQTYSAPIDGMLAVNALDAKRVRITGRYVYETVVDVIWGFPFSRYPLTLPFRTTYEVDVDLVATKGKLSGQPTYKDPKGSVVTDVTMHFWGSSYTTNETKTLPTIVIEPGVGWNKVWSTVVPIDESNPGHSEVLIHLEGAAPGH